MAELGKAPPWRQASEDLLVFVQDLVAAGLSMDSVSATSQAAEVACL